MKGDLKQAKWTTEFVTQTKDVEDLRGLSEAILQSSRQRRGWGGTNPEASQQKAAQPEAGAWSGQRGLCVCTDSCKLDQVSLLWNYACI